MDDEENDEPLPVTSYLCKWNALRKRKVTNVPIAEAVFEKHVYGRQRKHNIKSLSDFDPRPDHLRGQAQDRLVTFLEDVKGQGIGMSLMFDKSCRCWSPTVVTAPKPMLPPKKDIQERVKLFKESLVMTPQILQMEQSSRNQAKNLLWFSVRSYRIKASNFGRVFHRKTDTPPTSLVLQILNQKQFSSVATNWGIENEEKALERYMLFKKNSGEEVSCSKCGFVVCEVYPFLGASPDAVVYDVHATNPFGLVEINCPFSVRAITPVEAARESTFCCSLIRDTDGVTVSLQLKKTHNYRYYC